MSDTTTDPIKIETSVSNSGDILMTATTGNINGRTLYRFDLKRVWNPFGPIVNFIMLNPSTADAFEDDPTIRRCVGFAKSWGHGGIVVTNLYAWRATNPKVIRDMIRIGDERTAIGHNNASFILQHAKESQLVVAAWGAHARIRGKGILIELQARGIFPSALRLTAAGEPCHPLYLPGDLVVQPIPRQPAPERSS
jgi:hypothetical protein